MKKQVLGSAAAAAALLICMPAPRANAAPVPGEDGAPSRVSLVADGVPKGGVSVKRKIRVVCTVVVESPHRSGGKRHILFKTRVKCKSKDGINAVHVKVKGSLIRGKTSPERRVVARSNLTRTVAVNVKKPATYYTPKPQGKKIKASGWYKGHVYAKITSPVPGTTTSANSKSNYIV